MNVSRRANLIGIYHSVLQLIVYFFPLIIFMSGSAGHYYHEPVLDKSHAMAIIHISQFSGFFSHYVISSILGVPTLLQNQLYLYERRRVVRNIESLFGTGFQIILHLSL